MRTGPFGLAEADGGGGGRGPFNAPPRTPPIPPGQEPIAEVSSVSPDYFRVLGMPILRGRGFGPEDPPGEKGHPRSIIIDESFAQKYFHGKDPIGQHIDDNQTLDKSAPPMTIVGVVPRTRNESPGEDNSEKLQMVEEYLLASQDPESSNNLHIRTNLRDMGPLVAAVKRVAPRLIVLGGGGYNPWAVGRCWAGIWGALNDFPLPDRLPPAAEHVLRTLRYDRAAGRNPPDHWFTTLRDAPREGPVRPLVRALAELAFEEGSPA